MFDAEVDHLRRFGASFIIMGEREIARGTTEHIASRLGELPASELKRSTLVPL